MRAIADYAIAQWLDLMTRFGDVNALEGKLKELEGRTLTGSTGARINVAREGLWILKNHHEWATPSARTALASWLYVRSPAYARQRARAEMSAEAAAEAVRSSRSQPLGAAADRQGAQELRIPKALTDFHARSEGTSLRELVNLAKASGLNVRPAYRPAGAPLVTPAIAHLKPGHYAFVLKQEEDRVLLRDSILGGEIWFSRAALEEESSGYWLINDGSLPNEWRAVQDHEATVVIGRCAPSGASDTDPCDCNGNGDSPGMPTYFFHPVNASLRLVDTPLGYAPPRGPAANFTLSYNHREVLQPATFTYTNFGPMWTYDWLSYVQEVPLGSSPGGHHFNAYVSVLLRGSGEEQYRNPDANGVYAAFFRSRAVLVKVSDSPVRYERRLPDGGMEVFTQSNGAPSGERRIFLTSVVDPQGQALQITYDAQLRAIAFTDAIGQVTTVSYDHPTDPLKITKVTDPFGRFATFTYTSAGQLASITDVIGLTSSFTYANADFISAMTTPYGTTTFRHEISNPYPRMVEATDPLGGTEHLEFHNQNLFVPNTEPAPLVPTGFSAHNENLQFFNSFYWSKRQWALHPGDVTKARRTHWLLYDLNLDDANHGMAGSIPRSIKEPLENRVWYAYPGQTSTRWVGSSKQPERVGRVLDDGTSQIVESTYNTQGNMTSATDPLGRRVSYVYAANGIDLLEVRQTTGSLNDLIASYGNYTSGHQWRTTTDAAGEVTTRTFNANDQLLTVTNAKSETTIYAYDVNGRLESVTGPVSGSVTTFTHDSHGRVRTVAYGDGGSTTTDYDAMDRPTKVTYGDGTFEQSVYEKLERVEFRDRLGRSTREFYDALRRVAGRRDPLGRTTVHQWCGCGDLDALIDAGGRKTTWQRDLQGRVVQETSAGVVLPTVFVYENTTSRLKTVTDARQQTTTYVYNIDDSVQSKQYTNAQVATPGLSFTYDPNFARRASMTDGVGTTAYTYHAVGTPGALKTATIDGPWLDDTVAYTYDELGRVIDRSINAVDHSQTYDALERVTTETNWLGTFTYGYDGVSHRLSSVQYPNGQTTTYAHFGLSGDHRLQTIHHKRPDTTTLSRFDFTYDAGGNIATQTVQVGTAPATVWQYRYDGSDQLVKATHLSTGMTPTVMKRYGYAYSAAGDRVSEQVDTALEESVYDATGRLVQVKPGGVVAVAGAIDEPGTVTLQGRPINVSSSNQFEGLLALASGTTQFVISATDASGNTAARTFEIAVSGATASISYDANGNVTAKDGVVFEWNAAQRLAAKEEGGVRTEFKYDGLGQVVRVLKIENSITIADERFVVVDGQVIELRNAANQVVTRFDPRGIQSGAVQHFVTHDYLGSAVDITDASGTVVSRWEYDPFGRRTQTGAAVDVRHSYAGYFTYGGLHFTANRVYDSDSGRWLSTDPGGVFRDGPNLYSYVHNNPVRMFDPTGLQGAAAGAGAGAAAATATAEAAAGTWIVEVCLPAVGAAGMVLAVAVVGMVAQCGDGCKQSGSKRNRQKWACKASGQVIPIKGRAPEGAQAYYIHAVGYGPDIQSAKKNVRDILSGMSPLGWYTRHVNVNIPDSHCWRL